QPRERAVARLRSHGLRAAPVESIGELFHDPQLAERRAWRTATHPAIGEVRLMAPPFLLSDAEQGPTRPGPLLGQHTEEVFRGIVGLDAAEYAALEAAGVFR
ncbi:MAG TPA: CoA transferase, partial [Candidatus Limnocylindria bacterium]|nr:CoA transferase [Candidatus Limnocylindria bacterium]